jgi:hypothetical protein
MWRFIYFFIFLIILFIFEKIHKSINTLNKFISNQYRYLFKNYIKPIFIISIHILGLMYIFILYQTDAITYTNKI